MDLKDEIERQKTIVKLWQERAGKGETGAAKEVVQALQGLAVLQAIEQPKPEISGGAAQPDSTPRYQVR